MRINKLGRALNNFFFTIKKRIDVLIAQIWKAMIRPLYCHRTPEKRTVQRVFYIPPEVIKTQLILLKEKQAKKIQEKKSKEISQENETSIAIEGYKEGVYQHLLNTFTRKKKSLSYYFVVNPVPDKFQLSPGLENKILEKIAKELNEEICLTVYLSRKKNKESPCFIIPNPNYDENIKNHAEEVVNAFLEQAKERQTESQIFLESNKIRWPNSRRENLCRAIIQAFKERKMLEVLEDKSAEQSPEEVGKRNFLINNPFFKEPDRRRPDEADDTLKFS